METTCDLVQQAIIDGAELPSNLDAHRAACDACRFVAALSHDLASSVSSASRAVAIDPAIGTPLAGRYRIDALIGRGGQGQVYRALDLETQEVIALKLVRLRDDKETAAETANARRVRHPNICRVYHTERLGDHRLVVMEYIPGPTLADRLGTLSRSEVVRMFVGVCRGVQAAHEAGVLHLDLKPQNVLLRDGREPIVTDFGLSQRSERATGGSGTPHYMAPEQRRDGAVDHRADIYALGRILDDLVGERSWRLRRLARRASAADPAARPAEVQALLRAVEAPVGWRRRMRRVALGVAVLTGLLALAPLVLPPPPGHRAAWRVDLWDPDPVAAEAWNVALNPHGVGLPSAETPDTTWGCGQKPSELLDGRTQYAMWEHGVGWRPAPPPAGVGPICNRLRPSGRCGFPRPEYQLCELMDDGHSWRLLDRRVSDAQQFPAESQVRLGFLVPPVPCGERSVIVHLDRPRTVIAVRTWYREVAPRMFRVQLWDQLGRMHEVDAAENGQARFSWQWPEAHDSSFSAPVTTETEAVTTDRVRLVIDTCSTLEYDELLEYRAGKGTRAPSIGWLYEIEVFARVPRHEAWWRTLFGD